MLHSVNKSYIDKKSKRKTENTDLVTKEMDGDAVVNIFLEAADTALTVLH